MNKTDPKWHIDPCHIPSHQHPIALFARIDAVIQFTVKVLVIPNYFGTEFDNIEMRIASHKWVKGPGNGFKTVLLCPVPLMLLDHFTNAPANIFGQHSSGMRMQVWPAASWQGPAHKSEGRTNSNSLFAHTYIYDASIATVVQTCSHDLW